MERIADLQRGSLVELAPEGRRGGVERLSFHSPHEQSRVWAQTELDRDLDRVARGEAPRLPDMEAVREALAQRAQLMEHQGFGARDGSGRFHFRDGAMDVLKENELTHEGNLAARDRHGLFRDMTPGTGGEQYGRGGFGGEEPWKVRETKELFAGKTAILERGRDVVLAPVKPGLEIGPGDSVALDLTNQMAKAPELSMTKLLGRGLGLEL
jgi:hypothetical protein